MCLEFGANPRSDDWNRVGTPYADVLHTAEGFMLLIWEKLLLGSLNAHAYMR